MRELPPVRVLVVDDNPVDRMLAQRHLMRLDGVTGVLEAGSGSEAVEQVVAESPDVVLLDHYLGAEDGVDLLVHLAERRPWLPVIFVTGSLAGALDERVERFAADYLSKDDLSGASLKRAIWNAVEIARLRRLAAERGQRIDELVRELEQIREALGTADELRERLGSLLADVGEGVAEAALRQLG